jgi:Ca2+/Na+ antiporter
VQPFTSAASFLFSSLSCIIRSLLMVTIPRAHVTKDGAPSSSLYPLSFLLSFAWVSFWSFVISTVVEKYVEISGIGGGYYGVVLVCVGAEIPDTIQCVSVARRGYGSMAIANVVGSQVINILVGLGLPWFISGLFGSPISVKGHEDLTGAGAFLLVGVGVFALLLILPIAMNCRKPKLSAWKGKIMCGMYALILVTYSAWYFLLLKDEGRKSSGHRTGVHN